MKRTLFTLLFLLAGGLSMGAPGKRPATLPITKTAVDLFAAGKGAEAVAHLQANFPAEPGPGGAASGQLQALIEVANTFYNQRKLNFARDALTYALAAADTMGNGPNSPPAVRQASLLSGLGLLAEEVLVDLKKAEGLHGAAAALDPGNPRYRARKNAVVEKQKGRGAGKP
jgi:hypothetical protein